ncbi:MAG: hypothetical protein M0Z40_15485 [Actinomycetota bacterium]|jgi:uncharacterized protein (TIGR03382 family)|nr:hypothetical protein [Actinomycetota bacterium]
MSYVDAGYAIALGVLALYSLSLLLRRRRLERAASRADAPGRDAVALRGDARSPGPSRSPSRGPDR